MTATNHAALEDALQDAPPEYTPSASSPSERTERTERTESNQQSEHERAHERAAADEKEKDKSSEPVQRADAPL